jgi:hypothetical protein
MNEDRGMARSTAGAPAPLDGDEPGYFGAAAEGSGGA